MITKDFVFLSQRFYDEYSAELYPEIQRKTNRPYLVVIVEIRDITFAIPLRHHIMHRYSFITNRTERWGLDYSKAVIISRPEFIEKPNRPITINQSEYVKITDRKKYIQSKFEQFLNTYERAVLRGTPLVEPVLQYSTLQYFHQELGLTHKLLLNRRNTD